MKEELQKQKLDVEAEIMLKDDIQPRCTRRQIRAFEIAL